MSMRDTGDRILHSARLAFGYDHQYNDNVSFRTYLEGLMAVTDAENVRVNSTSELNSKLFEKLQIGLKVSLSFDNAAPNRGAKKLDTISTINLIYTLI
jgi:putative salt-induced outer membrane protein YdiY